MYSEVWKLIWQVDDRAIGAFSLCRISLKVTCCHSFPHFPDPTLELQGEAHADTMLIPNSFGSFVLT